MQEIRRHVRLPLHRACAWKFQFHSGAVIETGTAIVQCGNASETECDCSNPAEEAERENKSEENRERRLFGR